MASVAPSPLSNLPRTVVNWQPVTLSDIGPDPSKVPIVSFTFPSIMIADPLTSVGDVGSGPDNKAAWWPYFQERHKLDALFWVQGHMLNHNVHGPGVPGNLVPISNTLNTNMSAMVEELVKKMVGQGKILRYVVQAHWEGSKSSSGFADITKHAETMRKTYGMKGVDAGGTLLWGEQFAPTRLSWEVYEYSNWPSKTLTQIALSRFGQNADQWNNHFPNK